MLTRGPIQCRRDIAVSKTAKFIDDDAKDGVVAVLPAADDGQEGAAAYFCWQHKDQIASLTKESQDGRKAKIVPIQKRTSVDTLAERIGILDVDDVKARDRRRHKKRSHPNPRPARKETLPQQWQDVEGPLLAVGQPRPPHNASHKKKHPKTKFLCCVQATYEEPERPPRPQPMSQKPHRPTAAMPHSPSYHNHHTAEDTFSVRPSKRQDNDYKPQRASIAQNLQQGANSPYRSSASFPGGNGSLVRPSPAFATPQERRRSSQTQTLLSWIPPALEPTITSAILAELAKPTSAQDEEGYIYMFWLTTANHTRSISTPCPTHLITSSSTATPPSSPRGGNTSPRTVLLKIGRAANVQRRMNQWTRQCGYELEIIRFYPYQPSRSPQASLPSANASMSTKVAFSHKVERLIHLELAEKRVKRECATCGKEHREWFEVDATTKGMKAVDEVCRRWCGWAEQQYKK